MREVYAERLSALLECARQGLTGLLEISGVEARLQTAGLLCGGVDGETVAAAAAKREVEVTPLSRYRQGRTAPPEGLRDSSPACQHTMKRCESVERSNVREKEQLTEFTGCTRSFTFRIADHSGDEKSLDGF